MKVNNSVVLYIITHITKNLKQLTIIYLILAHFIVSCTNQTQNKIQTFNKPFFTNYINDVDSKFILTPDSNIIVSENRSGLFQLYQYKYPFIHEPKLLSSNNDTFDPFLFANEIGGLKDENGNEEYITTLDEINQYTRTKMFDWIVSSPNGKYVAYQLSNSSEIHLLNSKSMEGKILVHVQYKLSGISFSLDEETLVISLDDKLITYDITKDTFQEIASGLTGSKLNPSIYQNYIYFVNNFQSEYYQVFRSSKIDPDNYALIHEADHDLRMPKQFGDYLFYLEIINSEYILKRKHLINEAVVEITNKGVVYDYQFFDEHKLVIMYSDFFTPRSLIIKDLHIQKDINLNNKQINFGANYKFIDTEELSPGYFLYPPDTVPRKGSILFFHPGLHSDFSPRWETILLSLCYNGYIIVVPNYSMSSGYGKFHYNKEMYDAINDMILWKNKITEEYKELPLYTVAYSSGNILMEEVLNINCKGIEKAISLFGIFEENKLNPLIPTLYVFGKNDPKLNKHLLNTLPKENIHLLLLHNEGHWIRKKKNLIYVIEEIHNFLTVSKR